MVQVRAGISPHQLFLKLAHLPFQLLYLRAVGLALFEVPDFLVEPFHRLLNALQLPQPHGIAQDAVTEATSHLIRVLAGHVVEVMVDVFHLLEAVALLEEVGVAYHLDAAFEEVAQRVFQGFAQEFIGHRMVARGHDGEMHLVAWRAQLPVDERHETQHDVVVVRTGVINHLVVQDVDTTPELGLHVVDDFLDSFEAQVGDAGATGVVLQVVESQFVGITVEDLA